MKFILNALAAVAVVTVLASGVQARPLAQTGLTVLDQFDSGLDEPIVLGFDATLDYVWVYESFAEDLQSFSRTGSPIASVARPGEPADDVDIEFAPEGLVLSSTVIVTGSLLFINGETDTAEIYAVNQGTGDTIATLPTDFGVSHVIGGAYHPARETFFLLQDNVPGTAEENRIAEIDPVTGEVLNSFQTTGFFSIFYGDLDISTNTGNLFVVSSIEARIVEFTPTGDFVRYYDLPDGVSSLSGLGLDDGRSEAWVSNTNGLVWRLGGLPAQTAEVYLPLILNE